MINVTLQSTEVNDVTFSPCQTFVATSSGVDIINTDGTSIVNRGYITISGGSPSVFHKPDQCKGLLYIATNDGVKGLATDPTTSGNMSLLLTNKYIAGYNLLDGNVTHIEGNQSGQVAVATNSGIDYYTETGQRYYTVISGGVTALEMSDLGDIYYSPTVSGEIKVKYSPVGSNWTVPDYSVGTTSGNSIPSDEINDIQVNTISGVNHVFLATNNGLFSYEEDRLDIPASISGGKYFPSFP